MEKIRIAPSILSANYMQMGNAITDLDKYGADFVHVDVMDGSFVPNINFGMKIVKDMRPITNRVLDVHLMIVKPENYVKEFAKAGADYITVHYEACEKDVKEVLKEIRSLGVKSGISIKPDTDVSVLKDLIEYVDMILIMSVYPGFGGQKFIEKSLERLQQAKSYILESKRDILLEVDGGVTVENAGAIKKAGANVLVAGSSVFNAPDMLSLIHI